MSELTLLVLRFGFLLLLWLFILGIVYALRSDLFGQRVRKLQADAPASPFPSASAARAGTSSPSTPSTSSGTAGTAATAAVGARSSTPSTPSTGSGTGGSRGSEPATTTTASRLVITSGAKQGAEIALGREPLTIGRSGESGLIVRDDYTSTHHARLVLWDDTWMVQDLDSTNGTFLDGKRVTVPTQVPLNTPVKIGTTSFELRR